jgi:hypothetical protein
MVIRSLSIPKYSNFAGNVKLARMFAYGRMNGGLVMGRVQKKVCIVPIEIERLESNPYILQYRFAGKITPADLSVLAAREAPLFAGLGVNECFSVVADWSQIETIAAPLFPHLQNMHLIRDPKVCWVIVVGANPYLRALAISLGVISQNSRFAFRATLDEALRLLGEIDIND